MQFEQTKFEKPPEAPEQKTEKAGEAPEKEVSLEEKAKAISDFIFKKFIIFYDRERVKRAFGGKSPEELESALGGRETMRLVHGIISERQRLFDQMAENHLTEEELRSFIKENGQEMLPQRIGSAFRVLDDGLFKVKVFLIKKSIIPGGEKPSSPDGGTGNLDAETLQEALMGLMEENEKWKERSMPERERSEKTMGIKGFEKLDRPNIKGEDMMKIALELLPSGRLSANVASVEYEDEARPMNTKYGFEGEAAATFIEQEGKILLHKIPGRERPEKYFADVPFVLFHEWGHSLDPRVIDQKDLPPAEQLRMIKEWEQVRAGEEEWSSYVLKIKNPDKMREPLLKSLESLAESVAYFLDNPYLFRELHPKRYAFVEALIKERFPEFDFGRRSEAKELYNICLAFGPSLPKPEKEEVDKFLNKSEK